ncbi:MAG: DUF2946 domain-containing protein [Burkholderiaceae bacterium]|nr:DUF2946 domain-containing protein [Burkholderiaceae bacterium]
MPLSHALSRSANKSFFAEICTSNGAKIIAGKRGIEQSIPDGKQANGGMHCLFCVVHNESIALPFASASLFLPKEQKSLKPRLFYQAPQPLFSWVVTLSRAPPQLA